MIRPRWVTIICFVLLLPALCLAADPPLGTMSGVVAKATANVLMVRPRGPDGRFEKTQVLKIKGTSKVTMLTTQIRSGQMVMVQRETDVKDLQPNQTIVAIYTVVKDENILLAGVVHPAAK